MGTCLLWVPRTWTVSFTETYCHMTAYVLIIFDSGEASVSLFWDNSDWEKFLENGNQLMFYSFWFRWSECLPVLGQQWLGEVSREQELADVLFLLIEVKLVYPCSGTTVTGRSFQRTRTSWCFIPFDSGEASVSLFWDNSDWEKFPENRNQSEPLYIIPHYIHHIIPDVKLILMFRDPVER